MPAPICLDCRREMQCAENEVAVNDPPAVGFPASYWFGDKFVCPDCGIEIVAGFGAGMDYDELDRSTIGRSVPFQYA